MDRGDTGYFSESFRPTSSTHLQPPGEGDLANSATVDSLAESQWGPYHGVALSEGIHIGPDVASMNNQTIEGSVISLSQPAAARTIIVNPGIRGHGQAYLTSPNLNPLHSYQGSTGCRTPCRVRHQPSTPLKLADGLNDSDGDWEIWSGRRVRPSAPESSRGQLSGPENLEEQFSGAESFEGQLSGSECWSDWEGWSDGENWGGSDMEEDVIDAMDELSLSGDDESEYQGIRDWEILRMKYSMIDT